MQGMTWKDYEFPGTPGDADAHIDAVELLGTIDAGKQRFPERAYRAVRQVHDYLTGQGIEAERFIYEGRGGNEPVAANDTEENRAKNRRVEIIILED